MPWRSPAKVITISKVRNRSLEARLALLGGPGQREHALVRIGLLTDYGHLLRQLKREKEAKRLLRQASTEWTSLAGANEWNHTVDAGKPLYPTRLTENRDD